MILTGRLIVLALALTTGLLGACTSTSTSTCTSPQARPEVTVTPGPLAVDPSVDYLDPPAVCEAFAAAVHLIDTNVDRDPADAYQRTAAYLDATLAAAVSSRALPRRSPWWQEWTLHRAYSEVQVSAYAGDALPPNTAEQRHHAVLTTVQPVGRDGWRGPLQRHTVVCTLRLTTVGWRISDYEVW
ncbi:hypothetical protein ACN27F_10585 [Solwaraspora sp. WMMB335]|uniref:hypothetical protein n=1 Tax=Solwaraspora sp. WMMB335 TaxID=3404118 RepID=UPI003B92BC89